MSKVDLKKLDFPYFKNSEKNANIKKYFNRLKTYKPKHTKFNHFILDFDNEFKLLRITDYFSEDKRIKCQFMGKISSYDWYQKNKERIIDKFGSRPLFDDIDYYIWKNTKQCSNFPVIIAMEVLKIFGVKKWLDPSAGWGDRLIAALAYGCEYQGFDPNLKMQESYKEMVSFFAPEKEKDYKVTPQPFEKAKVKSNYYDLVFTSPPFFDLEDYDSSITQSHRAYTNVKSWKENFLYPLILKSEKALIKEGFFALYINNHPSHPTYVEDTMDFIKKNTKLEPRDPISWTLSKKIKRNIFIWKKIN